MMADGDYIQYVGSWNPGIKHDTCKTCRGHYHRCVCGAEVTIENVSSFCYSPELCATRKAESDFWKEFHVS